MSPTPEGAVERLGGVSLDKLDERASLRRRVDRKYLLERQARALWRLTDGRNEAAADGFAPPRWFGRDVTAEDAFSARSLACDGRPEERP